MATFAGSFMLMVPATTSADVAAGLLYVLRHSCLRAQAADSILGGVYYLGTDHEKYVDAERPFALVENRGGNILRSQVVETHDFSSWASSLTPTRVWPPCRERAPGRVASARQWR